MTRHQELQIEFEQALEDAKRAMRDGDLIKAAYHMAEASDASFAQEMLQREFAAND